MSVTGASSALYRPDRIHLWVEDAITREYLSNCWNDADIMFHIAGGNQGVDAILKDAQDQGLSHVFGFVDQDFGLSNHAEWLNPAKTFRRFVSGVHEVENYLLDPPALVGCGLNANHRTIEEIDSRMQARANELAWWMTCRRVIKLLYTEFCQGFLKHPKCPDVTDSATACQWIIGQAWYEQIKAKAESISNLNEIMNQLGQAYNELAEELAGDKWRETFSGKELFHHVRGYVYTGAPKTSKTNLDMDVARSVAQWQFANGRVPLEVIHLRKALRSRLGI